MQSPQRKLKEIDRLLSAFPPLNTADADETLRRYLDVAEDFSADLVEEAVTLYITGAMPGFDGRFAPTPPMLASGCRKAAENAARRKQLESLSLPRLEAPTVHKTADQMARGRALMEAAIENLASASALDTVEAQAASKARWEKVNARFQPDMTDDAVMARLVHKRPAFDVGNDGEDFAA